MSHVCVGHEYTNKLDMWSVLYTTWVLLGGVEKKRKMAKFLQGNAELESKSRKALRQGGEQ